jgi:hypothetical protein
MLLLLRAPANTLIAFPISEVLFVVAKEETQCTTTRHRPRGSAGVWLLLLLVSLLLQFVEENELPSD